MSRPRSKPEVPTQQPRGAGQAKRSASRARAHVNNANRYRDESCDDDDDDDDDVEAEEEDEEKPRRSRSAQDNVSSTRRSKHGWHGEGGMTSEDEYSGADEVSDGTVERCHGGDFEEEENIERELAGFTAQLDDLEGQEVVEADEVVKVSSWANMGAHIRPTSLIVPPWWSIFPPPKPVLAPQNNKLIKKFY